jgi:hypothetical protein
LPFVWHFRFIVMQLMTITICTTNFLLLKTHGSQIVGLSKCFLLSWRGKCFSHAWFFCFSSKKDTGCPTLIMFWCSVVWLLVLNQWILPMMNWRIVQQYWGGNTNLCGLRFRSWHITTEGGFLAELQVPAAQMYYLQG